MSMIFLVAIVAWQIATASAYATDKSTVVAPAVTISSPDIVTRPVKDKWALVIGISKFQDSSIDLKFPAKDARDFHKFLTGEANFAQDHVKLLINEDATRERILSELGDRWLPHTAGPDDLVVIYISSHGSPSVMDVAGINYLVAYNTDRDSLYATAIPIQDLAKMVKERVHSDRVVLFLDACHSGAAHVEGKGLYRQANFNADQIAQGGGMLVVCSGKSDQIAWESKQYPNGVFTHHLIEGLRQKGSDTKLGEAFAFTEAKVQDEVLRDRGELQTPLLKSKWEGKDLVLGIIPTEPRPGLPEFPVQRLSKPPEAQVVAPMQAATAPVSQDTKDTKVDPHKGIAGTWESNWGPTTFIHKAIENNSPVPVSGYWQQSAKHRGMFKSGTYDPVKGVFKCSYYQSWNLVSGKARLQLMPDGTLKGEQVHLGFAWHFPWLLWHTSDVPPPAVPQKEQ